ncbi:MAG: T9SS type A sorting domain-containing protein, partial [Chitinophagales bacterium]
YIERFKSDPEVNDVVKIGLPAANLPNCGDYPFLTDPEGDDQVTFDLLGIGDPCTYPQWNIDMLYYYNEVVTVETVERYAFDAIVLHPYYTPSNTYDPLSFDNSNWGNIVVPDDGVCMDGDLITGGLQYYTSPVWDFTAMDERLECAYNGLIGVGLEDGNFKEFIKVRYNDAYEKHAEELSFEDTDTGPENKEIWTTEWNYQVNDNGATGVASDFFSMTANSFVHAELLQEWFLKNIKANFDPHFRDNFFTYATVQNYIGITAISLLTQSTLRDQVELELETVNDCLDGELANYYVPKTTYHEMDLLKEISSNDLNFLKSTTTMYVGNINQPPTVFIPNPDPTPDDAVYVYFTNVKDEYQVYCLDPGDLGKIFDPDEDIELDYGTIPVYAIEADQLYSNSGTSDLFSINNAYDDCNAGDPNMFELNGINTYNGKYSCPGGWDVAGGVCVRVNPYSCGYFIISYDTYRLGEINDVFKIYPNPASNYFIIQQINAEHIEVKNMEVKIYDLFGKLLQVKIVDEGRAIDTSKLPVGAYTIVISTEGKTEAETLIKMH